MNAIVTNTWNNDEWIVELREQNRIGNTLCFNVCDEIAYILEVKTEKYRKVAKTYGARGVRTQMHRNRPKKYRMVFDNRDDAARFKEEWVNSRLLALQLANIKNQS